MIVVAGFGCVASCKTRTEWEKCVWLCGGDQKKNIFGCGITTSTKCRHKSESDVHNNKTNRLNSINSSLFGITTKETSITGYLHKVCGKLVKGAGIELVGQWSTFVVISTHNQQVWFTRFRKGSCLPKPKKRKFEHVTSQLKEFFCKENGVFTPHTHNQKRSG